MRRYSVFFDVDKVVNDLLTNYSEEKFEEYKKVNSKEANFIKEWLLTDTGALNRLGIELIKKLKENPYEES
jgi:alanine racemase